MRPLVIFQSMLSNSYHENDDRYKDLTAIFRYLLPSFMTIKSFITIKWQEKSYQLSKFSNFCF